MRLRRRLGRLAVRFRRRRRRRRGVTFNSALGFGVAFNSVAGHVGAAEFEEGVGGDGGTHAAGVGDAVYVEVGDQTVAHGGAGKGEDSEKALHIGSGSGSGDSSGSSNSSSNSNSRESVCGENQFKNGVGK